MGAKEARRRLRKGLFETFVDEHGTTLYKIKEVGGKEMVKCWPHSVQSSLQLSLEIFAPHLATSGLAATFIPVTPQHIRACSKEE